MPTVARANTLTWESAPFKELVRLGWPIAISMMSYAAMTLVDTIFVGRIGRAALAGVGLGGTAAFMAIGFSFGLMRSTKVLISQAVGAGRGEFTGSYLGAALLLGAGLGAVTTVIGIALSPLLTLLAASDAARLATSAYFNIRMLVSIPMLLVIALREARQAVGDARGPMLATIAVNVLNVILDYLFIFEFDWGVAGAAWATNIAWSIEGLLLLGIHRHSGVRIGGVRRGHVAQLWKMGVPLGLQFVIEIGAFATLTAMISRYSETDMAAHQIALQVLHFSFLPALAAGDATAVLVGQAVGARRDGLVRPLARLGLRIASGYTALCAITLLIFGANIAAAFTSEQQLIEMTVRLLWVAALFQLFDGANIVGRSVLRGAGDVRVPALVTVSIAWACTPPLTWLLGYLLGLGALGGWLGLCVEIVAGAAFLWWRLERGQWHAAAAAARRERELAEENLALTSSPTASADNARAAYER